ENQTELVIADASDEVMHEIESFIGKSNAKLLERRKSTTTLERLFLESTGGNDKSSTRERRTNKTEMTDGEPASTLQSFNASKIPKRHRAISPSRILTITSNTLTELTRLKVFYVLLVFGL